jgi:penicillin-binding protein 1C
MRRPFVWILSVVAVGGVAPMAYLMLGEAAMGLPSFQDVRAAYRPSDVRLLDRHGEVLHEWRIDHTGRRLAWAALAEISPALQAAVIASEDRRFFSHRGVDGRAVLGAVWQWLAEGQRRGASTISMQVVALLRPELQRRGRSRSAAQKWRQMRLAWELERRWSKPEILEAYLNLVTFRGELQGITATASTLFGKVPHGLTEAEAAVLAALIRGPNARPEIVGRRAWAVVAVQGGTATGEEVTATAVRAFGAAASGGLRVNVAPHIAQRLSGPPSAPAPVQTTLDGHLQRLAAQVLRQHLLAVRGRHVRDGAVLVVDNATGEVLAYVGGSGDLSTARYVDGIQARRQTGSTIKPFLYGLALEHRLLTPASLLEDTPLEVAVAGGVYRPQNYDEHFRGLVSVRTALAASLNIPAVRTLELIGADGFALQLRRLGLAGVVETGEYYGPALALGSVDASLWELVNAYRTLANGGVWSPLRLAPADRNAIAPRRVYSMATAFVLSHILSDRDSRSPTFGLENPLATRFWSAVKTGTSKAMRDNWCIGYTQRYTVGVWVGNLSGEPMRNVSGMTGAAPIWLEVVAWLHRSVPSAPPSPPDGVIATEVAFADNIEAARLEWFLAGTEPTRSGAQPFGRFPRILAPTSGALIALDPDIPPAQQRIVFEGEAGGPDSRWVLNGQDVGPAADPLLWEPQPGQHTLALVDEARRSLDTVTFVVRGPEKHLPPYPPSPSRSIGAR